MKVLIRALVLLLAVIATAGCASSIHPNSLQTAQTGALNSSDGTAQGASLCLPKGLTHEAIRSWELINAMPNTIVGYPVGSPDVPVIIMLYNREGHRAMLVWTLSLPITAVYYDSDIDAQDAAALSNLQYIKDKKMRAKPEGPCVWKDTSLPEA
jgi:hypothetical protein